MNQTSCTIYIPSDGLNLDFEQLKTAYRHGLDAFPNLRLRMISYRRNYNLDWLRFLETVH